VTPQQYDESVRRLESVGFPPDGLEYHCAFVGSDGIFRDSEVWDSREQFEKFGERLMPILADMGIEVNPPEVLEVHNTVMR
jgi:hypothetical protein